MPRRQQTRGVKVCAHCGGGYDAFKAMELRGRYCSPECLQGARAEQRLHDEAAGTVPDPVIAVIP
jgi:hypothetical protein